MNFSAAAAPLIVRAKPGLPAFRPKLPTGRGPASTTTLASQTARLDERAYQNREIVYFLNDPQTNSFSLFHDYTETRPGVKHYFNVVRAGSRASNASAKVLDTGEDLKVETMTGAQAKARGVSPDEPVEADTELVVISFAPVQKGQSTRLRISETYTDASRYFLDGDELVWDRPFGRPRNTVVLPAGWTAVASSMPSQISEDADGRQRLYFENPRPDDLQVLIRARGLR
jgi:hypothetical protein